MFKKLFLFACFMLMTCVAFSQDFPAKSNTLVTDFTNTLADGDKQQLEKKLVDFNDSTTTQIAVVIMKSVGAYNINDYTQRLGRAWGIGSKDKNNGILVLVALDDHKVSIQTGYGAEGAVPDVVTAQIIRDDITPRFKQQDYFGGLDIATSELIKYMRGEYKAPPTTAGDSNTGSFIGAAVILIFIVIVMLIIIFKGRGGGGGGQIYGGRGSASPFWWFLGGTMLGRGSGGWGGFSDGNGGFGGNSDSGSSSSGSSDSGGSDFGGFGGGDFGGGGSSGSW